MIEISILMRVNWFIVGETAGWCHPDKNMQTTMIDNSQLINTNSNHELNNNTFCTNKPPGVFVESRPMVDDSF